MRKQAHLRYPADYPAAGCYCCLPRSKQILELAKSAIWDILNDESEQGLAADNKVTVHQALVTMLEGEEIERQNLFQQLHQQGLQEQQRQQQPSIPVQYGSQT